MRKIIAIILCATMPLLSLVGCEKENNSQQSNTTQQSTTPEKTESAITQPTQASNTKKYYIKEASDFSEGYSWVCLENNTNTDHNIACINTSGEIQFILEDPYNITQGDFQGGTAVLDNSRIINTKGEIIFKTDETYDTILGYGDGYYAIAKHISDMTTNKYLICFMDTNGNWTDTEWDLSLDSVNASSMNYRGEGFFEYTTYKEQVYINPKEKKNFTLQESFNHKGQFQNGVSVQDNGEALLTTNGEIITTTLNPDFNTCGGYSPVTNGGFLYTRSTNNSNRSCNILNFYDISTHSSRTIHTFDENINITNIDNQYFENDSIFITLHGVDSKNYFTFLNSKGEQRFEPIKCDEIYGYSCDRIVTETDNKIIVYNQKGEKVFESSRYKSAYPLGQGITNYYDDIAIGHAYYDRQEFLDKNGNILFKDGLTYNGKTYPLAEIEI